jgi:hypothetical protein
MSEPIEVHVFGGKKGESIALRLPDNRWGVVDNYTPSLKNHSTNPTLRYLQSRGVNRLSFLCLTHPHEDHYRGMSHLIQYFDPDRIWIFGAETHRDLHAKVAAVLRLKSLSCNMENDDVGNEDELVAVLDGIRDRCRDKTRVPRLEVRRLQLEQPLLELDSDPVLKITAIGATGGQILQYEETLSKCFEGNGFLADRVPNINHNLISGGLLIEYGQARIVLGGDIETEGWEETMKSLASKGRLRSILIKASHHGSTDGYCKGLWDCFSPNRCAFAVITPYLNQQLPSWEGLVHISTHAVTSCTPSLKALKLAIYWQNSATDVVHPRLPPDGLLAFRALFPKSSERSEGLQGRCSFWIEADGTIRHAMEGEAALVEIPSLAK